MRLRSPRPRAAWSLLPALAACVLGSVLGAHAGVDADAPPLLRVGTSGDYAPFSSRDEHGNLGGFDVAVAERFAADLGRTLAWVPFRWPELMNALRAGTFDVAMSGVTIRPERAVHGRFTRPYVTTGAVALIRTAERAQIADVRALDRPDRRLGVNAGGHLERVARQHFPHATIVVVPNNTELPGLLSARQVDAVVSDAIEARAWLGESLTMLGPFTHDAKGYLVASGATALGTVLDDWLAAREADGWLVAQRVKWFGHDAAMSPQDAAFAGLGAAIGLRLQLMPAVAAAKHAAGLPVHDPAQEERVLARVRDRAEAVGVRPEDAATFFRAQMAAAKAVERAAAAGDAVPDATLEDLRAAIAAVSDQILAELRRCAPWTLDRAARRRLARTTERHLDVAGLTPSLRANIVDTLCRVRPAAASAQRVPPPRDGMPAVSSSLAAGNPCGSALCRR